MQKHEIKILSKQENLEGTKKSCNQMKHRGRQLLKPTTDTTTKLKTSITASETDKLLRWMDMRVPEKEE